MTKPVIKLLDLCCGAGGAAMGYCKAAARGLYMVVVEDTTGVKKPSVSVCSIADIVSQFFLTENEIIEIKQLHHGYFAESDIPVRPVVQQCNCVVKDFKN